MVELLIRFLIGGAVVSGFAALADILKPKSFAGLFGAAPSVALATLELTLLKNGRVYASIEAGSMILGAAAFFVYANVVTWLTMRRNFSAARASLPLLALWLGIALGLWWLIRS